MMKCYIVSFLFILTVFELAKAKTSSLLNPSWKHCIHRKQAKKFWQEIASPGYPHGITTQTQCSWIISVLPPRKIKVAFQNLNLTGSINNCFTQYVEFWEIKTASSKGKFCGDRRPGDYVTYGSQIRIDLKADTAAAGHQGFMIKYKLTKERGGFKKTHSLAKVKPSKKKKGKFSKAKETNEQRDSSSEGTSEKSSKAGGNGGRVKLGQRQRMREQAIKKQIPTSSVVARQQPAPIRSIQNENRPSFQNNRISISLRDGDEVTLQLWIIILIGVGGFLFLVLIAIISWLCFCRKRDKSQKVQAATDSEVADQEESSNNNELPDKTFPNYLPHNAPAHPIHRRRDLPGAISNVREVAHPVNQEVVLQSHPVMGQHALPSRAPKKGFVSTFQNKSDDFVNQTCKPLPNGFLYCPPSTAERNRRMSDVTYSSTDDEGYATPSTLKAKKLHESRETKIPTLKRKFSEWEKNENRKLKR